MRIARAALLQPVIVGHRDPCRGRAMSDDGNPRALTGEEHLVEAGAAAGDDGDDPVRRTQRAVAVCRGCPRPPQLGKIGRARRGARAERGEGFTRMAANRRAATVAARHRVDDPGEIVGDRRAAD